MSTSEFLRNHEQLISLSEKLNSEVKKNGQDVLNQINNMMCRETSNCILLKVINRIVGDTFNVISALQEIVIKNTKERSAHTIVSEILERSTVDLEQVVQKLRQCCNEIVQEYNNSSVILKQKFLELVENIIIEAECILNIIKCDDLPDSKHQLVENLEEILFMIRIAQVRIEVQGHTEEEKNDALADMQKKFVNNVVKFEKCSLEVLKNLLIRIRHIVKHNYQAVSYLHKAVSNFDDAEIQHKILESTNSINIATTTFLVDSENCNSIQEIIATLKNASIFCSFSELVIFILSRSEIEKTPESLKRDLVMYFFVHCSVVNKQIGKIIQQDMIDIDIDQHSQ